MKRFIILLLGVVIMSFRSEPTPKQQTLSEFRAAQVKCPTKYRTKFKPGFTYYRSNGDKFTLLRWVRTSYESMPRPFRWQCKIQRGSLSAIGWTDDFWIEYALDPKSHPEVIE